MLALVVAVLAVSYASSTRAWLRQRGETNQLTADIAAQRAEIRELRVEKRRLHDPAYIRREARMRFSWVMPGEIGYRVIGDDGTVIVDRWGSLSDPVEVESTADEQWWDAAWGSVLAAGAEGGEDDAEGPAESDGPPPAGHISRDGRERPTAPGESRGDRQGGGSGQSRR